MRASDRHGLLRLYAYGARGAIAASRLSQNDDGTYRYDLKRPLHDGHTSLVWTGEQLVRKLVPLIPPPFANLTRFRGVFAPRARLRARVIPQPEKQVPTRGSAATDTPSGPPLSSSAPDSASRNGLLWSCICPPSAVRSSNATPSPLSREDPSGLDGLVGLFRPSAAARGPEEPRRER
ncbi:MAG: transposase, partial [Myxococcota bacterium]